MNIGEPQREIEIVPTTVPVPEVLPVAEPSPDGEPVAEPVPEPLEPEPMPAAPGESRRR
jgi:hypothetical protein